MLRVVQLSGAVKVENMSEDVWVPVKKVVVGGLAVENAPLAAAQQGVRAPLQRVPPRLELCAAHVESDEHGSHAATPEAIVDPEPVQRKSFLRAHKEELGRKSGIATFHLK